jgi:hypothetical protein
MKRILFLLLACAFVVCLTSCIESRPNEASPSFADAAAADSSTEPQEQNTAVPAETVPANYEGLSIHDVEAVRAFLDARGADGKSNGEKLFEYYDGTAPSTWYYYENERERAEDRMRYIAEWDEDGYLTELTIPFPDVELSGALDLTGCGRLERVSLNTHGIASLNVSGCPLSLGLIVGDPALRELLPETIELSGLCIDETSLTRIEWQAVPAAENDPSGLGGNWSFKLTLEAEGGGSVGVSSAAGEHYSELVIYAYPAAGKSFVGWFDAEGKLVSGERIWELSSIETANDMDGEFCYTARFE